MYGLSIQPKQSSAEYRQVPGENGVSCLFISQCKLAGTSDSGKTTIMKQMQILYQHGIADEIVNVNVLPPACISPSLAQAIYHMWNDPATQGVVEEQLIALPDSAEYFLGQIVRIGALNYRPNEEDVLKAWSMSTGIYSKSFDMHNIPVEVFETSGSRSERKKWVHCFEAVSLVIFCVSLSEYNQQLRDDPTVARTSESLALFDSIVNNPLFSNTAIVLLLTKADIFRKKISQIPLSDYCPDYAGGPSFEDGLQYTMKRFLSTDKSNSRFIYTFVVDATDTEQVKHALAAIQDAILRDRELVPRDGP
ncbi:G-protein alpha subunit-domain-containing protein [Flammula alnicola]|nr:G-protein alpha subunit-domain-containing protein [Flammula alnicola]